MKLNKIMSKELPFDALGQEIQLGNVYGYTTTSSGLAKTTIGKAFKFSPTGKISLQVLHVKNFLYGQPTEASWTGTAETVSIRAHMLFPIERAPAKTLESNEHL